jgi:FHA domain
VTGEALPSPRASYLPGEGLALAAKTTWAVIGGGTDSPLRAPLADLHGQDADSTSVLEVLVRGGIANCPSFAIVELHENGVLAFVRGVAEVHITPAGQPASLIHGRAATTWIEHALDARPQRIEVTLGHRRGDGMLPLTAGVVQACVLELDFTPGSSDAQPLAHPDAAPAALQATAIDAAPDSAQPAAAAQPEVAADSDSDVTDPSDTMAFSSLTLEPSEAPEIDAEAAAANSYDDLFGHTVQRSVEEAAIREMTELAPDADLVEPAFEPTEVAAPAAEPAIEPNKHPKVSSPPPAGPDVIDRVPWAPPGEPVDVPVTEVSESDDGLTVDRRAHAALLRRLEGEPDDSVPHQTVHAVWCESRHPNPAHVERCRVCGGLVGDQAPVTIPRPLLGFLRMSTGDDVPLDRGVLMGRSPSADRLVNAETPHVVKVPSPTKDVSRDHLEIRLDGWHVLVNDLKSMNGTVVTLPGSSPQRLRPDEPLAIEPGTRVELADDVWFVYEVDR